MTDRLQPGMKHAPGVLCIVKMRFGKSDNDNKIVKIEKRVFSSSLYKCGCGVIGFLVDQSDLSAPLWEVIGKELVCGQYLPLTNRRVFSQHDLIPIGDSSLIEGEKWEEKLPREDNIELRTAWLRKTLKQLEKAES